MPISIIEQDIEKILSANLPWDRFYGKKILISGASGALARYMVYTLLGLNNKLPESKKCHVVTLVRNLEKAKKIFKYTERNDLTVLVQDVCAPISENADFFIHAASNASPKFYGSDPVGTIDANVIGTHNMLLAAKKSNAEGFLFFSTSEVYGTLPTEIANSIKETDYGKLDPTSLRSCYGESKRLGETMCVAWHHQHGVPIVIVRPFHIYGPGFRLDDGRVFADFVSNVIEGKNIVINSDGSAVRSFCYIADATRAFFTVLLKGKTSFAYNVGNPAASLSVKELAELLISISPQKQLKCIIEQTPKNGYIPSAINCVIPNIECLEELGWYPFTAPETGFSRMINSYMNEGMI